MFQLEMTLTSIPMQNGHWPAVQTRQENEHALSIHLEGAP
jgi:hypothetical protein